MTAMQDEMHCADVQKIVHPYLDGEFEAADCIAFERHLAQCSACREMVAFERNFKASLRARLRRPPAPTELRDRIVAALDRADAQGRGPVRSLGRRVAPFAAAATLAAGVLFAVWTIRQPRASGSPIVEDAIRGHEKNLPAEVTGEEEKINSYMRGRVPVPVRPPRLAPGRAQLVGARIGHLRDRDAAQIFYRSNQSNITLYVFDASGLELQAPRRHVVRGRQVYVAGARGYNVVFYRDRDVGYAFASDLDEEQLLELVSASFEK